MAPIAEMLPHIILKLCNPQASHAHGLNPMTCKRMSGIYESSRSGDCGPVAIVDDARKKYAVDIYHEMVVPLYPVMKGDV
ncbi:unnamed protein product [Arabis nemorensis]|uniref:Ubiquitin-like protease family profile domain-containing protein n=1 Tax=Arabis nemorensis TaxID=586526 RepID=A0A565C4J0_9BRAS|nr:unnamed protein product [Arabis nemorensis]